MSSDNSPPRGSVRVRVRVRTRRRGSVRVRTLSRGGGYLRGVFSVGAAVSGGVVFMGAISFIE